jgi:NADH:ubiquinone oxidoreductase subunit D
MILLYDNADVREIFSSRGDLMEEMDVLLEEIRQSAEIAAKCRPRSRASATRVAAASLSRRWVGGRVDGDLV